MHTGIKVGQMAQAIHTSVIRVSKEFVECVIQHTREAKTRMQGTTCRRAGEDAKVWANVRNVIEGNEDRIGIGLSTRRERKKGVQVTMIN